MAKKKKKKNQAYNIVMALLILWFSIPFLIGAVLIAFFMFEFSFTIVPNEFSKWFGG